MNFVKKYLKMFIGVGVLVLVVVVFVSAQRSGDLEGANLRTWVAAPMDRRVSSAKILTGADKDIDILVACVDKMATLPDSGEMMVRDALSLCYTGMQLKENL